VNQGYEERQVVTPRERFQRVLKFEQPDERLPLIEWAPWWDLTTARWETEGLPPGLDVGASLDYFGLDKLFLLNGSAVSPECPQPASHGAGIITDDASYEALKPFLYQDSTVAALLRDAKALKKQHDDGRIIIRLWLDGFFWFPRSLLGIERHLYSFYDQKDLLQRMNADLAAFNARVVDELCNVLVPDMVGFAEDMSYNGGPMLSRRHFREFLAPHYRQLLPDIKNRGIKIFVDSDGDITSMVPWLLEVGIEGVYPLERQAGVDLGRIRAEYPSFLMMGGYDKMVMPRGESDMRAEFERLLPTMRSGGYIPSVDHQTPPGVSLESYRIYLRLFEEYARKAALSAPVHA
jgi:hypothetical protein